MNFLLDTHVFLWVLADPEKLTAQAREAISEPHHAVFVSAVSSVEIAIKLALGKLIAPDSLGKEIEHRGLLHLPLHFRHGERMGALPPHHHDPFDRMLLAQAIEEELIFITHDSKFERYAGSVRILWT